MKKGNLICMFTVKSHQDIYELREDTEDINSYKASWYDEEDSLIKSDKYSRSLAEYYFREGIWLVSGNKCKRAIFKK